MLKRLTLIIALSLTTIPLLTSSAATEAMNTGLPIHATTAWTDHFLEANAAHPDDPLARAIGLAKVGASRQAPGIDAVSPGLIEPTEYEAPSAALLALAAGLDVELTPQQHADLRVLDSLEPQVADALAGFVSAFLAFDDAVRATNIGGWHAATDRPGPDPSLAFAARNQLLDAIHSLRDALDTVPVQTTTTCTPVHVPPAFTIDLATCDNTYTENVVLQLDAGGHDAYENNAGGNSVTTDGQPCSWDNQIPVAALVDLGHGNDTYGETSSSSECGVNGGAEDSGAGFLLDEAGDDTYGIESRLLYFDTANGGARGNHPLALAFGQMGTIAMGFLLDAEGHDTYYGELDSNGGGSTLGFGTLIDGQGDDAFMSPRGGASNGGSVSFGSGFLLDAAGDDVYDAGSRDSSVNGAGTDTAGINTAAALLLDLAGVDTYRDGMVPGGECVDCSMVPKGYAGAQVDH